MKKKPSKNALTMLATPTLLLLLALALAPAAARAQNPQYMSYQGYLTDGSGNALGSTNTGPKAYDVVFRIWDLPTGGTIGSADELFAELQTVTVDNGYFSVLLGQGTSYNGEKNVPLASVFNGPNAPRYVEMTVLGIGVGNAPVTILPRLQLVYAPYAFSAVNVSGNNVITAANLSTNLGLWQANGPNIYHPSGNVGIGTNAPAAMLDVNGSGHFNGPVGFNGGAVFNSGAFQFNVGALFQNGASFNNTVFANAGALIASHNTLQFGPPLPGQEQNAGKIAYELFTSDSLDIVGAGTSNTNRKIQFFAEGGANFTGGANFNGKVGISAPGNSPVNPLDVWGNADFIGSVGIGVTGPSNPLDVYGNADFIGSVGIGTTTPQFPLDVVGYALVSSNGYGYLNAAGSTGHYSNPPGDYWPYSIRAGFRIMAQEFNAVSDSRIKDIIGQSDGPEDLQIIQRLRVTDYRMKDRVANGDIPCKGFIAQEVETVIPEAVTKSRQFVPDIYAAASGAKFDPAAKTVAIKVAKAHGLKTGDRVRLMTEAGQMDLPVSSVPSEQEFVAANCQKDPKQVFVFGKEVNDFRTLNYDRIFTTGISAMQELARRVTTLEAHEAERLALQARAARVDTLEREVLELKNMVTQLAQSAKDGHSRPQTVSWIGAKEQTRDELTPVTLGQ